jgi:hypothetical protein
MISQTTRGGPVDRMVLDYRNNGTQQYKVVRRLPLAAVISPQFVRRREDKAPKKDDVRIEQVSSVVEVNLTDRDARELTLPKSQILRREVYTKAAKGETMVRKFVLWQTNKEDQSDEHPAFVAHFTDFSPNRAAPLAREIRISSSRAQIEALYGQMKAENIKKGWDLHSQTSSEPAALESPAPHAESAVPAAVTTPQEVAAQSAAPKQAASQPTRKRTSKKKSG